MNKNGKITQIIGAVVDVNFESDLPEIFADLFLRGINIKSIKENINSVQITNKIKEHNALADLFRLNGTPALIIGNEIVPGYIDLLKLMEIISKEFPNNA